MKVCKYARMIVCLYACMQVCKYENIQLCNYPSMQECKYAGMQVCRYASMQVCKYASMQVWKYTSMQVGKYTFVQRPYDPLIIIPCSFDPTNYWKFVNSIVGYGSYLELSEGWLTGAWSISGRCLENVCNVSLSCLKVSEKFLKVSRMLPQSGQTAI